MERLVDLAGRAVPAFHRRRGRPRALPLADAVTPVLFVLRNNATQQLAGELWGVSQATVARLCRTLKPVIAAVLDQATPAARRICRGTLVLVDGTLTPSWAWKNTSGMNSGKHLRTGHNMQLAADLRGRLLAVGRPLPGARHDSTAYRESGLAGAIRTGIPVADLGYPGTDCRIPHRKPRHRPLTDAEQNANRHHARLRSPVERAVAHLKTWKILSTPYRGPLDRFGTVLAAVAALEIHRSRGPF
ncbi:transposase [Streptacidiphilus sp. ASG 303]|uniref:transposase family protein n=1 Tax=Streptacidiphilus sp. ASG 303 TaxID=2896847 RepID=UPI001E33DF1E|nr:transposase family protein [Streptacidiphilus sp. ASG 303]MCD0486069.1 transposase [Streptacidiphilus sp. ASG 303]